MLHFSRASLLFLKTWSHLIDGDLNSANLFIHMKLTREGITFMLRDLCLNARERAYCTIAHAMYVSFFGGLSFKQALKDINLAENQQIIVETELYDIGKLVKMDSFMEVYMHLIETSTNDQVIRYFFQYISLFKSIDEAMEYNQLFRLFPFHEFPKYININRTPEIMKIIVEASMKRWNVDLVHLAKFLYNLPWVYLEPTLEVLSRLQDPDCLTPTIENGIDFKSILSLLHKLCSIIQ